MNAIDIQIQKIKSARRIGLMTHLVAGYPDFGTSRRLVAAMSEAGVDFIELQIPFSDPLADGPTLMHANNVALAHGARVFDALQLMAHCSRVVATPLLFMTYFNIIFRYGVVTFCRDAARVGCSGLIVPDLPLEEDAHEELAQNARRCGLTLIRTIAPATTPLRLRLNALAAQGFIYLACRQGVTGARQELDLDIFAIIELARREVKLPLAVGFGIARAEHIRQLKGHADIAVVGSAVVQVMNQAAPADKVNAVSSFVRALVAATR